MAEDLDTQLTILNRSVRVDRHRDRIETEADERHVKKLAADLGLTEPLESQPNTSQSTEVTNEVKAAAPSKKSRSTFW